MTNSPATAPSKAVAQSPEANDPANPDGHGYLGHDLEAMLVADRYNREIVRMFSPFLGEHVVEVGAGIGNVSVLLLEQDLARLHVIEPDDVMYARVAERLRRHDRAAVHRGFLASVAADARIDTADSIVSVNVLEHVEDDVTELALMHSTLRPGGHLCLWVPAVPALYSSYDRSLGHYRRYRKPELSEKLRNAGFEIVQMEYKDFVGMVAWFVCCRVLGLGLTPGNVLVYDRVVLPLTTFIGRRLRLPIGKNLLAIARRT